MKIVLAISFFCLFATQSLAQYGYDTVRVYFPINITALDEPSKRVLDSVAQIARNSNMLIYGYADYLGNEPANLDLAINRANNVKQYLLDHKINPAQILVCEGIGQINRNLEKNKDGVPEDRRVGIFIRRSANDAAPGKIFAVAAKPGTRKMKITEFTSKGNLIPVKEIPKEEKKKEEEKKPEPKKPAAQKNIPPRPKFASSTGIDKLGEMKPNEVLRIELIHFIAMKHFLKEESIPVVEELLQTLQQFPDLAIRIEGHVCCISGHGDAMDIDTQELKLSENRARYIYDYLVISGISKDRLEYAGYGKQRPIVPIEITEEDAQKNRRVEIRVLRN